MNPLRQLALFFILLAALLVAAYETRTQAESRFLEFPMYADKLERIDEGHPARLLLLGESRTVGVTGRPELAEAHGLYNLSLPALQGVFQFVYVFERYLENNPAPKAIILGSDPLAYAGWCDVLAGGAHGAEAPREYHFRYASRVFDLSDLALDTEAWRRPTALWSLAKAKLDLNKFYFDFLQPSNVEYVDPNVGTGLFKKPEGWRWISSLQRLSERPFEVSPVARRHLERLLETAKAHDVKVVAYHPPIFQRMYDVREAHGFYARYSAFLDELEAAHPDTFIAYRPVTTLGYEAFVDGQHYSRLGSQQAADRSLAPMLEWLEARL